MSAPRTVSVPTALCHNRRTLVFYEPTLSPRNLLPPSSILADNGLSRGMAKCFVCQVMAGRGFNLLWQFLSRSRLLHVICEMKQSKPVIFADYLARSGSSAMRLWAMLQGLAANWRLLDSYG